MTKTAVWEVSRWRQQQHPVLGRTFVSMTFFLHDHIHPHLHFLPCYFIFHPIEAAQQLSYLISLHAFHTIPLFLFFAYQEAKLVSIA